MAKDAKAAKKKKRRTPFLKSKLLFWILMILCFPLALFILWRYKPYEMVGRCIITLLLSFILCSIPFGYHYYSQYEALAAEKAAQEAVINSDPLYGYRMENLTLDQASFLKYYDLMSDELDDYNGIDTNITQLIKIVKENNNVNIGVMLAHLDSYEERLAQSAERINAIDLSTFSEAEQAYFAQEKQTYLNILSDVTVAYKMLETAIGQDDVNSSNGSSAIIAAKNKEISAFRNQLKLDAARLKVSLTTKKPLNSDDVNMIQLLPETHGPSISPAGSINIQPAMPHAADDGSQSPAARVSLDSGTSTMVIDINGTKIEGDVISIY